MHTSTNLIGLLGAVSPGERIFMGGSSGEVIPFTTALAEGRLPPLNLTTSFVPGVNFMPAQIPEGTTLTNPFPMATKGAVRALPLSYGEYSAWLANQSFDACIVQVAPPVRGRMASLSCSAEFTPMAMSRSRRIIAVINPQMPDLPDAASLDLDGADLIAEVDHPLAQYLVGTPSASARAIAEQIAVYVSDGAALQVGLGKVPDALMAMLVDRRGLRMQSGMISDGIRTLFDAGSLDAEWKHMSCVQVGTAAHYGWLHGRSGFAVLGCEITHDPARLSGLDGLVAVNGALEVDLFGQANLEFAGTRRISGVGGAADFARAASLDPRGISIVGLPSDLAKGTASRIVPRLETPVSLPRHDIEVVVTEHGSADLRGLTVEARADRLIAIAAPGHRAGLAAAWEDMAR